MRIRVEQGLIWDGPDMVGVQLADAIARANDCYSAEQFVVDFVGREFDLDAALRIVQPPNRKEGHA